MARTASVILALPLFLLSTSAAAADYVVAPDGDDAATGTVGAPFRTIAHALAVAGNGDSVQIRAGTYRLMDEQPESSQITVAGATESSHLTIEAYQGEHVVILGSLSTQGRSWEAYPGGLYRVAVDDLPHDPTGMFLGDERIEHVMKDVSGTRSHADVADLSQSGQWTKADASGIGCPADNGGCYVYLFPAAGQDPNSQAYELSQRGLFHTTGDVSYMAVRGLTVLYTQDAAFSFEGGRGQLIEGNVLGHNSNGNDNAYSIFVSYGGGVTVRNNVAFDSRYWGGTPNSKGITLMDMDPNDPSVIEGNEIYDIIGQGVASKDGVANVVVRGNYLHDVGECVQPAGPRCHWTKPNCVQGDPEYFPGGGWEIHENAFVRCGYGVSMMTQSETGEPSVDNRIYNNVFYHSVTAAVDVRLVNTGTVVLNNIFLSNPRALFLDNGGSGTAVQVSAFLPVFTSHHNLFFANDADYLLRPDWGGSGGTGTAFTLAEMVSSYSIEPGSVSADPLVVDPSTPDFHLQDGSPAANAGDGSVYGTATVDIGMYPQPDGAGGTGGAGGSADGTAGGGAAGSAGSSMGGSAGTAGVPGASMTPDGANDGGCGCHAADRRSSETGVLLLVCAAFLAGRGRRQDG